MTTSPWAAGRYESVAERIAPIAENLVATLDQRSPLAGRSVVDLACGTGTAALAAADRAARVTGVDITAELLALGAAKAAAAGHDIDWVRADAAETGLPTEGFDAAVSNMGIIFVDPVEQVAEISRLLKPGGVLGLSAWVRTSANPLHDPLVEVLGNTPPPEFTPDQWGDPDTARSRLSGFFTDIEIQPGTLTWEFASLPEALRFVTEESPVHVAVLRQAREQNEEQSAELVAAFGRALGAHVDAAGRVRFDAPYALITAARA
ncbi:class I SAM-dependent methyltransferase [Mycolicibacterium palauense]|uniref:class I SAM-dependent methyltransferase n=1 Tax=Mycolicibacterium palauense TaxID=2034511 RepID=UPI001FE425BC|nr:class I SAM-dependent methyltransferase [Mycolicibacterium palauense]